MKSRISTAAYDGTHIATALELQSGELVTADKRMAEAASVLGLHVQEIS